MGKKQKEKKSMSLAEFQESVGGGKPVTATPSFAYSSRGAGKVADEDVQLPSAPLGEEEWEARGIPAFGRHAGKPMREFRDDDQFDELRDKDWVRRGPMEGGGGGLERGGFGASEGMGGVDPDAVNWERRGPIAAEGGPGTASRGELDWSARRGPVTSAAETGAGGLGDFGAPKDVDWSNARKGPLELSTPLGEGSDEFGAPKVVDWSRARQGPLSPATGAGASSILDRERDGDVDWNAARRGPLENGTQPVAPVDFTDVRGKMVSVAAESDGAGTHNHHQRDSRSEIDWNKRKGPVEARPSRPDARLIPERGAKLMELGSQKKELVLRGGGVKAEAGDERNWEGARAAVTPTSTATEKEERESDAKDGDDAAKSSRQGNSHTAAKPHASPNGIGADTRNRDIDWARGRGSPAVSSGPVEKGHEHQDKAGQKGAQAHGRGPRGHHTPELQTNAHGHGHGDSATLHPSERDWSTARNATATVGPVRKDRDSNSKRSGKNSSAASPPASASVDAEVARQDNVASTESITSVPETTTSASSVEEDAGEWHEVGAGRKKEKGPNTSKVAGSGGGGQGPRKQFSIPKSSEAKGKGTECSSRKPRGEGNQQGGKSSTDKRDRQNKGHGKRDEIEKDEFVHNKGNNSSSISSDTAVIRAHKVDVSGLLDEHGFLKHSAQENVDFCLVGQAVWQLIVRHIEIADAHEIPCPVFRMGKELRIETHCRSITFELGSGGKSCTVHGVRRLDRVGDVVKRACEQLGAPYNLSDMVLEYEDGSTPDDSWPSSLVWELDLFHTQTLRLTASRSKGGVDAKAESARGADGTLPGPQLSSAAAIQDKSLASSSGPKVPAPPPPPPPPPRAPVQCGNGASPERPKVIIPPPPPPPVQPAASKDGDVPVPLLPAPPLSFDDDGDETPSHVGTLSAEERMEETVALDTLSADAGLVGLTNLGNTCFMNSSLQCLSNTELLSAYFLTNKFQLDLNASNPLGMGGELAIEYNKLLRRMWLRSAETGTSRFGRSSYSDAVAPRAFKAKISHWAPQFVGYYQHDSQELLAFLLDGLHEDLNRVQHKPLTEPIEAQEGENECERAAEAWRRHKLRHDSVIVDHFQGQYKSRVVCPTCRKVSITFDPFMYLTVPIPDREKRLVTVLLTRLPGPSSNTIMASDMASDEDEIADYYSEREQSTAVRPIKFGVLVRKRGSLRDVRLELARLSGVRADHLVFARCALQRLQGLPLPDELPLDEIRDMRISLVAYELQHLLRDADSASGSDNSCNSSGGDTRAPSNSGRVLRSASKAASTSPSSGTHADPVLIEMLQRVHDSSIDESHTSIAHPQVFSVPREQLTGMILYACVRARVSRYFDWKQFQLQNRRGDAGTGDASATNTSRSTCTSSLDTEESESKAPRISRGTRSRSKCSKPSGGETETSDLAVHHFAEQTQGDYTEQQCGLFPFVLRFEYKRVSDARASHDDHKVDKDEDEDAQVQEAETGGTGDNHAKMIGVSSPVIGPQQQQEQQQQQQQHGLYSMTIDLSNGANKAIALPASVRSATLIVEWKAGRTFEACFQRDECATNAHDVDESASSLSSAVPHDRVTLYECMEYWAEKEVLSAENAWYCPTCKEHKRAEKSLQLWSAPDILIVHLKRFFYSTWSRQKMSTFVEFPTHGFDISSFVGAGASKSVRAQQSCVYDLFAVSNHFGGLGGGHYTAAAQSPWKCQSGLPASTDVNARKPEGAESELKGWYTFDDSHVAPVSGLADVVSSAAYVLFYRRRAAES